MYCPFCNHEETKVIDSRLAGEGRQIRRRRQCVDCNVSVLRRSRVPSWSCPASSSPTTDGSRSTKTRCETACGAHWKSGRSLPTISNNRSAICCIELRTLGEREDAGAPDRRPWSWRRCANSTRSRTCVSRPCIGASRTSPNSRRRFRNCSRSPRQTQPGSRCRCFRIAFEKK